MPANATVELRIDGKSVESLPFLGSLPANGIHSIVFERASITAVDLSAITKMSSLHSLEFNACTFAVGQPWMEVEGAPHLRELLVSDCKLDDEQRQWLVQWSARCKSLNGIYGEVAPKSLKDLQLFEHHSAPLLLDVELSENANANAWMVALSKIPRLAVLNLSVPSNAPEDYWRGLRSLQGIQSLSVRADRKFTVDFMGELDIHPPVANACAREEHLLIQG